MKPVAAVSAEYRASAALYLIVGVFGLVGDIASRDTDAARSLVPFAVLAVVTLGVLSVTGVRWLTRTAPGAPPLPAGAAVQAPAEVWRRAAIEVVLVAILMVAGIAAGSGIGAVIAGLAFGSGAAGILALVWLGRFQSGGRRVFRETPERIISNGRRPLYLRA